MKHFLYILFFVLGFTSFSQNFLKGENIINYKKIKFLSTNKDFGKVSIIGDFKWDSPEKTIFKIETKVQPKFIYNLATKIPLNKEKTFKKGTLFLVSFQAKTEKSSLETGEAKVLWMLNQSKSFKDNLDFTLSLASEWKTYYIPYQTTKNINVEDLKISMQYGFRPQVFLIKNLKFEVFPKNTKLSDLPKTKITYAGIEANATWRTEALKRIENLRKGDFTIRFTKNGKPLQNKGIQITLKKHYFNFGAAMSARDVVDNTQTYQNFKKGFNLLVFENDLKIKRWQLKYKREITLQALEILKQDSIDVKGHVLIWPGFKYLTKSIRKNKDNPEKIKQIINNHVSGILKATKNKVSRWDVVNEVYTNKDLQNIIGSEDILYNGFKIAKNLAPNVGRFTNEYGIISKGGIDTKKQEWYFNFVKRIDKNTGGLVDGIGIQSHIGSDLTPPEKVLRILDYFGNLNKKISISEFTMDIQEPEIRTQYTRDFLIAAFSHPKVSEFLFWGFMDNKNHKVDIYKPNGEIGAMGKAFFDLVHHQWKTNITAKTDTKGKIATRGFYGTYEYQFLENGKVKKGTFSFQKGNKNTFTIHID